ncbi:helix-turn-helix transcriptional regulator [Pseudomonas oryzihabitans]|uniref:helix-turn-helix transcriptional regulator n=1 Tax=Pseudomonas oryzihabitans TaxID=47885 RepID=UPI0028A94789|nr:helix-turn-helix transcriptional regulator [Pseudomonas oryzihabitans]
MNLGLFSKILLDLYHDARELPLELFHSSALALVRQVIAFDRAWWGRAAVQENLPQEHSSYLLGLPGHYLQDWQGIRDQDPAIAQVHAAPGRTQIIDSLAPNCPTGLAWLARKHDFGEFLCIMLTDPVIQLSVHLALYRQPAAPRFDDYDREMLDSLMPHLVAAEASSHIRTLVAKRAQLGGSTTMAMAVCDRHGRLQTSEEGFAALLLLEWPHWSGPQLPAAIDPSQAYQGREIQLESTVVHDLNLLTARRRNAMELLSAREREVAQLFGLGRTYKDIARQLLLSPYTVRHHLKSIYAKLGVSSKAEIARLLHPPI